jgi:hypothetical protein
MNPVIDTNTGKNFEAITKGADTQIRRKRPISKAVLTLDPGT